ncbi:uncharacterized protein LOC135482263 [Liolophura sinensis]|uniref:uncharacterized protein LOC135482263 n=1 Tax=Liolophura sinensis TaxID=3198878 RepID=UPI003158F408
MRDKPRRRKRSFVRRLFSHPVSFLLILVQPLIWISAPIIRVQLTLSLVEFVCSAVGTAVSRVRGLSLPRPRLPWLWGYRKLPGSQHRAEGKRLEQKRGVCVTKRRPSGSGMGGCCPRGSAESRVEEGTVKYNSQRSQCQIRSASTNAEVDTESEIEQLDSRKCLQEGTIQQSSESPKPNRAPASEQKELNELRNYNLELPRRTEKLGNDSDGLKRDVTDLQEVEKLKVENERLKKEICTYFTKISEVQNRCEQLENQHARSVNDLNQITTENNQLKKKVGLLRTNEEKKESELRACQKQLEDMTCRFSKAVSDNLRLGNPALEDLSTANRPLTLADRYRVDLYGGAWCDALCELTDGGISEESALLRLYDTVTDVYKFSLTHRHRLLTANFNDLFFSKPDTQKNVTVCSSSISGNPAAKPDRMTEQTVMDLLRKTFSPQTVASLQQLYNVATQRQPDPQTPPIKGEMMAAFTALSLELCWLFAIQEPPMVLYFQLPEDKIVDHSLYQFYKKAGTHARCVIWPALLLHSAGNVLCKGEVLVIDEPPGSNPTE